MSSSDARRIVILDVYPQVDSGRSSVKRIIGDLVEVQCDLVADGHDIVTGALLHRKEGASEWATMDLEPCGNDRFRAAFRVETLGVWEFTVEAWVDAFATWRSGLVKKSAAGQDVSNDLILGARLLQDAATRAAATDKLDVATLIEAARIAASSGTLASRSAHCTSDTVSHAARRHPDRSLATRFEQILRVVVDPERARFSAWYEMFPRSCGRPNHHGTLRDCAARLPHIASMGFDIVYLPPIHPIGRAFRKGPNNALEAGPNDVGSPWAIGGPDGGHKSLHSDLGTLDDFRMLVQEGKRLGLEIAIDIAFQASPDHPYVREHPEWFRTRPDGTIQYAENPPKKYQDIFPFDFECEAWQSLWNELLSVVLFWCEQGVRIFRADNPHTKSIRFWQWCIAEVKARHPEAIFLAEAFTRPKLMYALAMAGFTQSYTYFTWRNTAREFKEYLTELTTPPISDYFRPNFWPNTPDILPEHLQFGGRPAFVQRLILAATLSSNYGIYGPPFERMEHVARPQSEEYIDSEKYQIRAWPGASASGDDLRDVIAIVNDIRRSNAAFQANNITFHRCENENLLCFSKRSPDKSDAVLVIVNMDVHHTHSGTVDLELDALGLAPDEAYQAHDLLSDARYEWRGSRCYCKLDPQVMPASIFKIRRRIRTEYDFEYFS